MRHIFTVLALLLLSIFSTAVFAAESVDCVNYKDSPDPRCLYARIWSTRSASLFVVEPGQDIIKANALPNKEFFIYIPTEAPVDSLKINESSDPEKRQIKNMTPVRSDGTTGLLALSIRAEYPRYNYQLGTAMSVDDSDPLVNLIYNFYAPKIEYSIDGEVVTDLSSLKYEVGDTILVDVRTLVPIGPKSGELDAVDSMSYYFSTFGECENLQFLSAGGTPLKQANGSIHLLIRGGKASFKIFATSAVTDGSTFGMSGYKDKKDSSKFIVNETFPGKIQFVNPNMPSLDSAAIYDADGDGVGDSIAAWFGGSMDYVSVDEMFYSWPKDSSFKQYSGSEKHEGLVYGWSSVSTELQTEGANGSIKVHLSSSLGDSAVLKTPLLDRIGAAIQSASLFEGNSVTDTLVIRFNKVIDSTWTEGQAFLVNGKVVDAQAVVKNGNMWTFVIDSGTVAVGDMIKIETACQSDKCSVLTAADGVPTAANNQKVPVTASGRVYMDNKNNGFYDRNGDGRMDSISVGFTTPVSKKDLERMELIFYWLDEDGDIVKIVPNVGDLSISDDGLVVGYALDPDAYNIKSMLTGIHKSYSKDGNTEYGYAEMFNKVTVDGNDTTEKMPTLLMHDYMPPVISGTFLNPESFQEMEPDRFRVTFSEAIRRDSIQSIDSCLSFYVDGKKVYYDLSDTVWSEDGQSVVFLLEAGDRLTERMNPADSVSFGPYAFGDTCGNYAGNLDHPVVVMVKGDPRVVMQTTSMADLNRAAELSDRVKPFTIDNVKGELNDEQKSSLGVLMDVGFSTIMVEDSTGKSIADVKSIGLKWELFVYTNLGAYVGSASGLINCDDPFFDGNCLENPDKLYVRWNMRADNGRKVGVGLYLAKFNIKVFGAEEDFKVERVFRWGVTASHHK